MSKTHLNTGTATVIACHRFANARTRRTDDYRRVSCLDCRRSDVYTDAAVEAAVKAAEEFANQEPRTYREPWREGDIVCPCGNDTFRYNGRSLDNHYYVCAACGETTSRWTETRMSA